MGQSVPHVASHNADFSALLWCLAVIQVCCLGWLFYLLYGALR